MQIARLTRNAIEMPSTAVALTPKSRPMVGSATLTIVASRMDMNIAATKTTPTATFWLIRGVTGVLSPRLRPGGGAVSWYLLPGYKITRAAEIPAARVADPGAGLLSGLVVYLGAGGVVLNRLDPVQRKQSALNGIESVKKNAPDAAVEEKESDATGGSKDAKE